MKGPAPVMPLMNIIMLKSYYKDHIIIVRTDRAHTYNYNPNGAETNSVDSRLKMSTSE